MKLTKSVFAWVVVSSLLMVSGASAAVPDSRTGVITACKHSNGSVNFIDYQAGKRCARGWSTVQWNAKGAVGLTGPRGLTGSPGLTGPQGPAGPKGEAGVSTRGFISTHVVRVVRTGEASASAYCPIGEFVTGGGGYIIDNAQPSKSIPAFSSASEGVRGMGNPYDRWEIHTNQWAAFVPISVTVVVFVICAEVD